MPRIRPVALSLAILSILILSTPLFAQQAPVLITQNVDNAKLATLAGNTRPEANKKNDRGLVPDGLAMEHMLLQLKRSPQQEQALVRYIDGLQDKSSSNFHRWLTAKTFGKRFGLAAQDINVITRWLESEGFKVNVVFTNGLLIDFSGTAGQVRAAFHTEIHQLEVNGVKHFANMSDPQIPAALSPAVVGVVSLHDFKPHANYKPRPADTFSFGGFTYNAVVPGDLATIYNFNPLFTAGISGQGQTIVVVEDTDLYSTADWAAFRSTFGLSSYAGSLTQVHPAPPTGPNNCTDPGVNGDDGEAIIDAEYASAAAPSAAIKLVSCTDTATFGGLIAIQNLLNESATPPAIMSMSYGECEAFNGASSNAAYNSAFQQAVMEGVSVFVSAGDEGAASCDPDLDSATHGIGVNGWGSTPYNVAVGGTDFGDSYANTNSTYWSATNSSTYESALSYVPEIPWNDSCASVLISTTEGFAEPYGPSGFCNSSEGEQNFLTTGSGSGGPSGCATGSPANQGVVGGTCAGWPKPTWQSLVGNPSDGVRDLPDVSLFAANGVWGHLYVFCFTDPDNGGSPCTGAPDPFNNQWSGAGGTSFGTPIMAGIQALVNQKTGSSQGPVNPVYYSLAATEYGASGDSSCNSTLGNAAGSSCIFYDVTLGDMDVNCLPYVGSTSFDCYYDGGTNGVLSTSNSSYQPAYGTKTGWDFATGIGTVNAANLVNGWPSALSPTTTSLTSNNNPSNYGDSVTFTATVVTSGPDTPTGTVVFNDNGAQIGTGPLGGCVCDGVVNSATATFTTSTLAGGSHPITAVYGGDSNNAGSTSAVLTQVVNGPTFTLSTPTPPATILSGQSTTSTFTVTATGTGVTTFAAAVNLSLTGLPTDGTVTYSFSLNPIPAGTTSPVTETLT
ncbi:MAG TPA: protease pro-enzyme activation domain-containing protein, partial [Candidatus Acidoferrum sp.]|nr:protease pro-enzyme activation domain-containing protein [Candidatus Acidoferrum sp.]